ncbi:MAG: chitobiase/beta-hexosaminidase C-terminal domain-containing protein [Candidatus Cloacimonetes bacterium]|nr:chitobiase/beta-hexosaminidase C-terminal domain-containing protein [Candidatus Cloacimonadota bacterium]MDD2506660.1 chitobiase/beta-hexosaminidase C-terminal domain-containing protein [Candidatus Cloacimonadota bacterium]MDD4560276.1 chitobiase/beta-hexosaminidase C-terminal domain-containing protein [Candidatus Cloacimonadota bacterium]
MKKTLMIVLCLVAAVTVWAQGQETFANFDYTGTNYIDGSFTGDTGVEWNYYAVTGSVAGSNDNSIEGQGMILRRSEAPSRIVSSSIPGGIGNFSVQMRKAYTSAGDRQIALYINDLLVAESEPFGGTSGADPTVYDFVVNGVNVPGDFVMEIRNIQGGTSNRQVTIDNIEWTAYGSGQQFVANPTFNPPAGHYDQPINVTLSTTTEGASIYYTIDGSEPTQSSTLFSTPINVSEPTTIKARGYAEGYEPSAIVSAVYGFVVPINNLTELRAQTADNSTVYKITNDVFLTYKRSSRNQKYVQDHDAAVLIDDTAGAITTNYEIGDAITGLTGKLSMYFETLQFIPTQDPGPATSTNNWIHIPTVTIGDLNADIGTNSYQSRLVYIDNVNFTEGSGNFASGQNYTITDGTGNLTFRTAFSEADYIDTLIPTGTFSLNGLVGHYQETAQITPRNLSDFNPTSNEDPLQVPAQVALIGNYPNPFNPETTIQFQMEKPAPAIIDIFNQKGQLVKSYDVQQTNAGVNSLVWNGLDNSGSAVSSGVYFFRLRSGSYSSTKKMVLMK